MAGLVPAIPIIGHCTLLIEIAGTSPAITPRILLPLRTAAAPVPFALIIVRRCSVALGIRGKNVTNDDPMAARSGAGNITNKEWAGGSMFRRSLRGGLKR